MDRAVDQGVLPHLLLTAALAAIDPNTHLLLGTDVVFSHDESPSEIDIIGIHGGKFVSGEVKTDLAQFTSERVSRDIDLSKRLGAQIHIMAAINPLPDATKALAMSKANAAGLELLVFDASSLRPS